MRELTIAELNYIGGGDRLREPIQDPQSEFGKAVNDVAKTVNDFGKWLGGKIYDILN